MEEAVCIEIQQELNASIEIETENTESQNEANTSNENKSQYERMVSALEVMIEKPEPSFSFMCHIKRIPDHLRKVNEQAYSPMIISIGPFHHFDKKLQTMEMFKVRYLKSFMKLANVNLKDLVNAIGAMEEQIYCCYAETSFGMDKDDFFKVILVDAIFILELIFRNVIKRWEPDDLFIIDKMDFIICDLVLFENQLPFFVLEVLFNLIYPKFLNSSLIDLTFEFFEPFNVQKITPKNVKIEHFTDLIRIFQLPQLQSLPTRITGSGMVTLSGSATQLYDAGVKFEGSSSTCLLDLHYEKGVLKMPRLKLDDQTEALVRNVMALEQFCLWNNVYLTDYFIFLDSLINTIEDINLLCYRRILVNRLGDNKAAFSSVKKLITGIKLSHVNSDFTIICEGLNKFYNKPFHRLKVTLSVTTLKNQYFNNPWRGAGTIAACLLLLLTLIQTIMSILQVARA